MIQLYRLIRRFSTVDTLINIEAIECIFQESEMGHKELVYKVLMSSRILYDITNECAKELIALIGIINK